MVKPWRGDKPDLQHTAETVKAMTVVQTVKAAPITLAQMVRLCEATLEADARVEDLKAELKRAEEVKKRLHEETIPGALQELSVKELVLDGGFKIACKQDVFFAIPAGNKPAAFDWLEDHELGGLIKTEVTVPFGKGELEQAVKLLNTLNAKKGVVATLDRNVNHQTLGATLREMVRSGKEFPLDTFGARPVWVATVKRS